MIIINKCKYCGSDENIIHHHVKYKELHGVDDVILLCVSCHQKLHRKLRREGKCNVPPEKLREYSVAGRTRGQWRKEYKYNHGVKYRAENKEKIKSTRKKTLQRIDFEERMDVNISLMEEMLYNHNTGHITYTFYFRGYGNRKIIYKDVV